MAERLHAFEFLTKPQDYPPAPVCVAFGAEAFLKQFVVKSLRDVVLGDDQEMPFSTYSGREVAWRDIRDELATVSLFGQKGRRLVVVDDADEFVSRCRVELEDYVASPSQRSVVVLVVDTWPGNTRLAKSVAKVGLPIDCRLPQRQFGRTSQVDENRIVKWLIEWSQSRHQAKLVTEAANTLLELVGPELGLLDQELAKLAIHAGIGGTITADLVQSCVGGWRAKTTWEMLDAAADGNSSEALRQLDRLLQAGEVPQSLFGQMAWFFRRFTSATRNFERAERTGRRSASLKSALREAGFRNHEKALQQAERQLKHIGRERAGQLTRWLLELDLALKGTHSADQRGRLAIEQFLVRLSSASP
jgi:DNA polymerase-3 subunit delta